MEINSVSIGKSFIHKLIEWEVICRMRLLERLFLRHIDTVRSSVNKGTIAA